MARLLSLIGGVALAAIAAPGFAASFNLCGPNASDLQQIQADEIKAAAVKVEKDAAHRSESQVTAAPATSAVSPTSGFDFQADAEGGTASLRIGGSLDTKSKCEGSYLTSRTGGWSVTVSAPLTSKEGEPEKRATLDGLAGSTSLEFNVRQLVVRARATVDTEDLNAVCRRAFAKSGLEGGRAWQDSDHCSEYKVQTWARDMLPEYRAVAWGPSSRATVWGGSGKVGQEEFGYYEPATLAKLSDQRTGWSLKAYYAVKPLDEERLFTVQYEHQVAWEGQEEKILCPAGGGAADCVKGAPGKPNRVEKDILAAEYRQRTGRSAFALNLSYDARNEVAAIGLPIYLTTNGDGQFIGGIRFDWRSDTGEAKAAVFVGVPLLFGLPD